MGNVSKCFGVVLDQKWGFGVKNWSKPSRNENELAMASWCRSATAVFEFCGFRVVSGRSNLFLLHCFDVLKPFKLSEQAWSGLHYVLGET